MEKIYETRARAARGAMRWLPSYQVYSIVIGSQEQKDLPRVMYVREIPRMSGLRPSYVILFL